jgi:hypothetical protein
LTAAREGNRARGLAGKAAIVTRNLFGRARVGSAGFHFSGKCSNVASKSGLKPARQKKRDAQWGVDMLEFAARLAHTDARPDASPDIGRMLRVAGTVISATSFVAAARLRARPILSR